jgi:hypothetical protein
MATGTQGTTAREYSQQMVHYLRKSMTYNGTLSVDVGTIPAGAVIVPNASGAFVTTAFTASTTVQTLDIGYADDADEYASALVLTSAGQIELDVETDLLVPADRTITATLTAGSGPTAGALEVIIAYIPDNDG